MALPTIFPMGYVTRCGFKYLLFSTLLGGSNLTNMFQLDWNYQQLGGFCRKQKSCQCLFWCVFFSKKTGKNHYQNNLKYVLGKLRPPQTNRRLRFPMKCLWWNVAKESLPKMLSRFLFFWIGVICPVDIVWFTRFQLSFHSSVTLEVTLQTSYFCRIMFGTGYTGC